MDLREEAPLDFHGFHVFNTVVTIKTCAVAFLGYQFLFRKTSILKIKKVVTYPLFMFIKT